jgi:lysyl-tRNA synthetase
MEDTNSLIEQRKAKLAALRAKGIDPFQNKFTPGETCAEARGNYVEGREVAVAGRITAHRDMGKSMFIDVRDQSGRIQVYAQKNTLGDELFSIFQHLDLADFIGVKGALFTTKTGEISVKITNFTILAKALRSPPAKWHGLEDTEIRYRQRYLDLIANPDVKDVMLKRSAIIHEIRNFFHERKYVEVETPVMQPIPGGAAAQPFVTKHNALGCEFYLRIALELYHKRLLVGGIDKLFEIGKNFRNEGLSRRHNPEFTMLEAYCAFGDYATMMETVESLITTVAQKVLGTLVIEHPNHAMLRGAIQSATDLLKDLSAGNQDRFVISIKDKSSKDAYENAKRESENAIQGLLDCQKRVGSESTSKIASEASDLLKSCISFFSVARDLWKMWTQDDNEALEFWEVYSKIRNTNKILVALKKPIDLQTPWKRQSYKSLVQEEVRLHTGDLKLDWFSLSDQERREIAVRKLRLGRELAEVKTDFEVTQAIFENYIEPCLIQPTFVTHLPKELVPLAKLSPDDPTTVEVFECCINGQEISPGYTEQNDPIAQRTTLEHQAGGEQQKLDEDFLVALEHGMPPAGGIGIGIDRLCMMLLGQESIRDVILFPQLKPK